MRSVRMFSICSAATWTTICLREMGVGDLSVPRKMQGFAEAFYGRVEAYDRAFAGAGDELAAAPAVAGVSAVPRLTARFDVTRRGGSLHVVGEVEGSVGQTCVVTLEPMTNEVREPVDLVFVPAASRREPAQTEEAPIDPIDS